MPYDRLRATYSMSSSAITPLNHETGPSRRAADWIGAIACTAVAALVLALFWFPLGSVDLGYHLAYGRHFLDAGRIVEVDPFIYPEVARPFVNANWGSQIVMAAVERAAGAAGLVALRTALLLAVFACIAAMVRRATKDLAFPAWACLLAAMAAYERFTLRPELFSYACMAAMLVVLCRGLERRRDVAMLVALQLAWVNFHSYFLVGPILTGSFLIGAVVEAWRRSHRPTDTVDHASAREADARTIRLLAVALGLQAAALFVNPWFHRGAIFPITTLGYLQSAQVMGGAEGWSGGSAWSAISEFKSPFAFLDQPINIRTIHAYLAVLAAGFLGIIALAAQGRIGPALAVIALLAMSTQMRRNIAQFAIAAAPLSMAAFSFFRAWSPQAARMGKSVRTALLCGTIVLSAWWCFGIVEGRFYFAERRVNRVFGSGFNERIFPIGAARWIADHADDLEPELFVNYFASSNVLPWLPAKFRVFVDTNTFAYDDASLATSYKLGLGQENPAGFFDRYGVNVVLLHCSSEAQMLVRGLADDYTNWALVYFDRHAVIFVRRTVKHIPVIRANPRDKSDLDAAAWIAAIGGGRWQRAMDLCLSAGVPISLAWPESAIPLCEEAVRLVPDYHEAWQFMAVCHGNLGNEAMRAGRLDEARGRFIRAAECFEKVLTIQPDHKEASEYGKLTVLKLQEVETRQAESRAAGP